MILDTFCIMIHIMIHVSLILPNTALGRDGKVCQNTSVATAVRMTRIYAIAKNARLSDVLAREQWLIQYRHTAIASNVVDETAEERRTVALNSANITACSFAGLTVNGNCIDGYWNDSYYSRMRFWLSVNRYRYSLLQTMLRVSISEPAAVEPCMFQACFALCTLFIRSPVLWTQRDHMFWACFFFLSTHFLRRPLTDILETFPHDVASAPKEALLCRFPESAT